VGRRILFKNLKLKSAKQAYVFPDNVNFDEEIELDPKDEIDKAIIFEKEFIIKNNKLPELLSS